MGKHWMQLGLLFLVVWETFWFFEWMERSRVVELLRRSPVSKSSVIDDRAAADAQTALLILLVTPFVAVLVWLAIKWIIEGFRQN